MAPGLLVCTRVRCSAVTFEEFGMDKLEHEYRQSCLSVRHVSKGRPDSTAFCAALITPSEHLHLIKLDLDRCLLGKDA